VAQIPARQAKKENYDQSAVFLVKMSDCDNCHAKPQLLTNDKKCHQCVSYLSGLD